MIQSTLTVNCISPLHAEMEEFMKKHEGKPWAIISYHKEHKMDMVMPLVRGFLICLVSVWLCCVVIGRMGTKSFYGIFSTALSFGIVSFLFVSYMGHNWMDTSWEQQARENWDFLRHLNWIFLDNDVQFDV